MKLRIANSLSLLVILLLTAPASAQHRGFCGTPPFPGINPIQPIQPVDPVQPVNPQPSFFLGVSVSTVEVEAYGRARPVNNGMRLMVAPGAGQAVYGQRINHVAPNSPAAMAGLEPGDILLDANGYPLDTANDLQTAINTSQGRLEMKVIDSRTGRMMWVTARTDAQSSVMMSTNNPQRQQVLPRANQPARTNLPATTTATRKIPTTVPTLTRDVRFNRGPIFRGGR